MNKNEVFGNYAIEADEKLHVKQSLARYQLGPHQGSLSGCLFSFLPGIEPALKAGPVAAIPAFWLFAKSHPQDAFCSALHRAIF